MTSSNRLVEPLEDTARVEYRHTEEQIRRGRKFDVACLTATGAFLYGAATFSLYTWNAYRVDDAAADLTRVIQSVIPCQYATMDNVWNAVMSGVAALGIIAVSDAVEIYRQNKPASKGAGHAGIQ